MADEILEYYERELAYLRREGAAFAQRYGLIAGRLMLESDKCDDPHVERLLEGVAFLAARVHHKLDEEFPEITSALLQSVAPHLLSPLPSCSIAQFYRKPEADWTIVPRGVELQTQPIRGYDVRCRFRTCSPVTLWPIDLVRAEFCLPSAVPLPSELRARSVLRLRFRCPNGPLADSPAPFAVSSLRLYLDGDSQYTIYDLLFSGSSTPPAFVSTADGRLTALSLCPAGFAEEDALLPAERPGLAPYLLLTEYFGFPAKFLSVDLCGLDARVRAALDSTFDVLIPLSSGPPPSLSIGPQDFRLGCTPIINLFQQQAEPISLTRRQPEYRVIPDVRRQQSLEVHSIEEVLASTPGRGAPLAFRPFFSIKNGRLGADAAAGYFVTSRRPGSIGSEVYVSLVDMAFSPLRMQSESLLITALCTNRDLPVRLPLGTGRRPLNEQGGADVRHPSDFMLPAAVADAVAAIDCLQRPTATRRPGLRSSMYWRLISHLSLNHLSLVEEGHGLRALQGLLLLYEFINPERVHQQAEGLLHLSSRRTVARARDGLPGFCRGVEVSVTLDADRFVGGSQLLFEQVLDRFFGLYTTLNSFVQLVTLDAQGKEIRRWPPRAGTQILV